MGKDLKDTWKDTGIGLGHAFRDLGKSLIKTGATAMKKADEWAEGSNAKKENEATPQEAKNKTEE